VPARSPESIFAEWYARQEGADVSSIEALLGEHPEHAGRLRELHSMQVELQRAMRHAGLAGSLAERLKSVLGSDVDPRVELEGEESGDFTEALLGRLSGRGPSSGRYHLKGEVAHGGMGAVLRVWDEDLRRHLAMKVLLGRGGAARTGDTPPVDKRHLARFLEEAQVTGQLDHPGIVPVHELGLDADGRVFFTMKLVKGKTLAAVFDELAAGEGGWSETRVLGLLLKVCEAMSYAHAKGVIHRDLKPANVMVGRFGEVYVMDWGLAKILGREDERDLRIRSQASSGDVLSDRSDHAELVTDSPLYTMDGDVVGTPAYMPPEQAAGRVADMGPASDVYALGAMLYHLLARRMPYVPSDASGGPVSPYTLLMQVQEGPPPPLHELAPDAPAELVAISAKAMARESGERYADMRALAADLSAYVEGRVVHAYETGAWAEARKWVRRNKPLAAALAAAVVLAVLGAGSVAYVQAEGRKAAQEQQRIAEANAARADEQAEVAREEAARADAEARIAQANERVATERADDVLRLSALQDLEDLLADADALWPPHPERIEGYRAWIARGETLVGELPRHRAKRAELRALALPRSEEQRQAERASHPELARLAALKGEVEAKRRALLQRRDGVAAELPEVDWSEHAADASGLNAEAWPLVDPARKAFGREPLGLVLARRALELAGEDARLRAEAGDTLAWASFAMGLDDAARAASAAALAAAPAERREELAGYLAKVERAVAGASTDEALDAAAQELARRQSELADLDARVDERREWRFPPENAEARWWNAQLTKLIDGLEALSDEDTGLLSAEGVSPEHGWSVPKRLAFAERLDAGFAAGGELARRWESALPAIRAAVPGLDLRPQMGLVPIGPDPESGLWEFWHVATGAEPERDASGKLVLTDEMGVVLVLLPGGTFWMGAQKEDPAGRNHDPQAERREGPVHPVTLSPCFLSKYELTQGQWMRIAGRNPSYYHPGSRFVDPATALLHPVEQVSWLDCTTWLPRVGLTLPSEAQWERACRAGTDTVWWTGSDRESLREKRAANVADQAAARAHATWADIKLWPELDDGHAVHAPIGSYAANAFGLHEMHGNVWEWCLDGSDSGFYARSPVRDPVAPAAPTRVYRGGSFDHAAAYARSAHRNASTPSGGDSSLGVRPARAVDP
jgi:formylglycine-generating enzyme required for sulfatase activity/serine/threonine protein kinase